MEDYKPFIMYKEKNSRYFTIQNILKHESEFLKGIENEEYSGEFVDSLYHTFLIKNEEIAKQLLDYLTNKYVDGDIGCYSGELISYLKQDRELENLIDKQDKELTEYKECICRANTLGFSLIKKDLEFIISHENNILFISDNLYDINKFLVLIHYRNVLVRRGYKIELTVEKE